jgi:tetratricopeptide (TPR) repeat protein
MNTAHAGLLSLLVLCVGCYKDQPTAPSSDSSFKSGADQDKAAIAKDIEKYKNDLRKNPRDPLALFGLGLCHARLEHDDQAIKLFTQAIEIKPDWFLPYKCLGIIHAERGEYDSAIRDYDSSISSVLDNEFKSTNSADVLQLRGRAYWRKNQNERALEDFDAAIRLDPRNAEAYAGRGLVRIETSASEEASSDFDKALQIDKKCVWALLGRGLYRVKQKSYDKAVADFTDVIKQHPRLSLAFLGRGMANINLKHYDDAAGDFTEVIRLEPRNASAFAYRAHISRVKKEYDNAITDYVKALQLDPNTAEAHNEYAWFLATCPVDKHRNGTKAIEHAMQACELSKWKDSNCLDTLAAAHAEAGHFSDAVKWQQKALSDSRNNAEPLDQKALARLKLYEMNTPYRAMGDDD